MPVQLEPVDFVKSFLTISESSNMYFTNSTEFAQMFALMLGETGEAVKIQYMKEHTSEDINIELYRVEVDVMNNISTPEKKIKFKDKDGTVHSFYVDELHKALKLVRLNCFGILAALVVKHKISFDVKLHVPTRKLSTSLKKDFTRPRETLFPGVEVG